MIHDRYFYDPAAGKYTVDRYLDDLQHRYGGIDSVLVWQSYPNMGIDNRNQYDLLRDMPGGVAGVRQMIADFHRHGVRVLFPVMVWDQGTRDEGVPNWTATARLLAEVGADGVNGDTLNAIPRAFRIGFRRDGPSPRARAREPDRRPWPALEQYELGLLGLFLRSHRQHVQVAGAAPHGEHLPALGARQDG